MQITGYALREALKQWELRLAAANNDFNGSLHRFKDDVDKPTPQQVVASILASEQAIVALQLAQMKYNLSVQVEVQGQMMTLAEAIKHVGAAGKIEKIWKTAAVGSKQNGFFATDPTIRELNPNQERAVAVLKDQELLDLTRQASKRAGALKTAIATANAVSQTIPDLDPSLFE